MSAWEELQYQAEHCTACELCKNRSNVVFGMGNRAARLMLIGEGPGAEEDRQGKPFVGAAGKLLDEMLDAVDIPKEEVYIANVVKCRPPQNRTPRDTEAQACLPYLQQQIELVNPQIILLLGATALKHVLSAEYRITKERGIWHEKDGRWMIATFHPAALLRDAEKKPLSFCDMVAVKKKYKELF